MSPTHASPDPEPTWTGTDPPEAEGGLLVQIDVWIEELRRLRAGLHTRSIDVEFARAEIARLQQLVDADWDALRLERSRHDRTFGNESLPVVRRLQSRFR